MSEETKKQVDTKTGQPTGGGTYKESWQGETPKTGGPQEKGTPPFTIKGG